jgi:MYXO-CTERM domain-containing protein
MRLLTAPIVTALLALAACSSSPGSEPTASSASAIINGKDSPATQDAVVLLVTLDGGFGTCTGTLIASNLVLTARHCVSNTKDSAFACDGKGNLIGGGTQVYADHPPNKIWVFTGADRSQLGPGSMPQAKGAQIIHDGAKVLCNHDLALVVLDREIEGAQIAPIRVDSMPMEGETFTAVGWGVTEKTPYPTTRQMREGIKIKKTGPFDGSATIEPVPPNDVLVGESICSGDSGGPALHTDSGAVLGVVSRGGNGQNDPNDPAVGCIGATNLYTAVAPFRDLVLAAFEAAGKEPWIEGQPDPRLAKTGVDCTADEECRGAICAASQGKTICSQDCSADAASCPEGFTCQASNRGPICLPPPPAPTVTKVGCSTSGAGGSAGAGAWGLVAAAFAAGALRRRRARR